ncbi:hypothetical protein ACIQKE_35515 [Streptomyces griseoviridis]|uniref:H-type lectin domain-containing protein n=2 Tax=Streptomyces TaxID=1883 RepID=A0A3Q9KZD1_STRGD|nr:MULTISPECIES: hypothetical protein [Streptomyces]AZS89380.1 hypothetical protein ELQ87_37885 [Streptomyces griseoviridis]MDH6699356.1 hypothetical protein [Streptomyces sp. MAA16]MDT0474507.1 hypothetical protein [Streptomyces sp. DSM 41014]QCN83775.1 hypothetical protein DDJ31_01355 [Streptomyces griseoviridis]
MSMTLTGKLQLNSGSATEVNGGVTTTFTQVTFPTPFPSGADVIVVPFVQTFNGPDTPGLRIADVTRTGFKIRINELVGSGRALSDGSHTTETIGWIASTV